jgi:hypothetical protein
VHQASPRGTHLHPQGWGTGWQLDGIRWKLDDNWMTRIGQWQLDGLGWQLELVRQSASYTELRNWTTAGKEGTKCKFISYTELRKREICAWVLASIAWLSCDKRGIRKNRRKNKFNRNRSKRDKTDVLRLSESFLLYTSKERKCCRYSGVNRVLMQEGRGHFAPNPPKWPCVTRWLRQQ